MFALNQLRKSKVTHSDKKTRVNPYLDPDTHEKLLQLSISCGMTKTKLSEMIIKMSLNQPDVIRHLQDLYNKDDQYRIITINDNGKIIYSLKQ